MKNILGPNVCSPKYEVPVRLPVLYLIFAVRVCVFASAPQCVCSHRINSVGIAHIVTASLLDL